MNQLKRHRLTTNSTETLMSAPPSLSDNSLHADPLSYLPLHLMAEILYRLPVKSLLHLKCVCKSWNSLITDRKFAMKHLHMSRATTTRHHLALIVSRQLNHLSYPLHSLFTTVATDPTQLVLPQVSDFVFSCDGIFCFSLHRSFFVLCNPSLRKSKILPPLENPIVSGERSTLYSFGYDPFIDNYKVIAIFCYDFECDDSIGYAFSCKTHVKLHTLGTNYWRRIQEFPHGVPGQSHLGKFVGGTVNWITYRTHPEIVIVSLDLENNSYQEILPPDYGGVDDPNLTVDVLRDCLCIFSHSYTFTDVWLMKEYGNKDSWTKLFRVPYMGTNPYRRNIIYISEDDQVLLQEYQGFLKLALYDARSGSTIEIPTMQNIHPCTNFQVYIESLVSP